MYYTLNILIIKVEKTMMLVDGPDLKALYESSIRL